MKILSFGSLNVDYVYKVAHIVRKGETISAVSRHIYAGGKGLNQSIAMARAGLTVFHAGCIGPGGEFLLDTLHAEGIDTEYIGFLPDVPVGHTVIQNSADGDNCIILFGGANQAVTDAQINEVLACFEKGDYIVLQNEISCLNRLIDLAYAKGMHIVLNPSPISEEIFSLDLRKTDYLFVNEIEAAALTGVDETNHDLLTERLAEMLPETEILLTLGEKGAFSIRNRQKVFQPAFKVQAVDTTAAGDTFTGFYLGGIISGMSTQAALEYASKAASIAVTRSGAVPSIPLRKEVVGDTFH